MPGTAPPPVTRLNRSRMSCCDCTRLALGSTSTESDGGQALHHLAVVQVGEAGPDPDRRRLAVSLDEHDVSGARARGPSGHPAAPAGASSAGAIAAPSGRRRSHRVRPVESVPMADPVPPSRRPAGLSGRELLLDGLGGEPEHLRRRADVSRRAERGIGHREHTVAAPTWTSTSAFIPGPEQPFLVIDPDQHREHGDILLGLRLGLDLEHGARGRAGWGRRPPSPWPAGPAGSFRCRFRPPGSGPAPG